MSSVSRNGTRANQKSERGNAMKLAIIGGGPGGYVAAIRAAQLGASVTLIEKETLGGTCLNVGCIPTKVLLHATHELESIKRGAAFGLQCKEASLDWQTVLSYKQKTVGQLTSGVGGLLKRHKVEFISGTAAFASTGSINVRTKNGAQTVQFDKAVIASGSMSASLPIPGADAACVITSNEALCLEAPPKSMVIVGGGVIGVELACVYARLGCKVTIVEFLDRILANMDAELITMVARDLKKLGVEIRTGCKVTAIDRDGTVHFASTSGNETEKGENVLMAVGRKPNTGTIGLEKVGVSSERGAILVNEYMQTSIKNIYAIGDCTGGMMLAHVASEQGIVAVTNAIQGDHHRYDSATVPACVYTYPELAMVGMTEERAKQERDEIKVGKFPLVANGKAMLMGTGGLVKIIADAKTEDVLGMHIYGPGATDMIHEGALAIRLEATIEEIVTTVHAHPTVAEAIGEAANDVRGLAIHI